MSKFRVTYKFSRVIDLGEINAKNAKEAEEKARYQIEHNVLLRAEEDGLPRFIIENIRKERKNEKK
jgi:hypothetical protein